MKNISVILKGVKNPAIMHNRLPIGSAKVRSFAIAQDYKLSSNPMLVRVPRVSNSSIQYPAGSRVFLVS